MDDFFKGTQERAFRVALMSVRDRDIALDMVQDAMIKLAEKYANKPPEQWPPLFYRILQNRIRDWHRAQMVRNKVIMDVSKFDQGEDGWDPLDNISDQNQREPVEKLQASTALQRLHEAVKELPQRQREVFLLRAVEELSVAQTATSLNVSQGSIKTHYSRALSALRGILGDHWP